MKRFLMLIVAVMALVVARGAEQGYFKFEVSNGQAVITGLTTAAQSMNLSTLEIPGFIHYNGLVWPTRIRTSAFQGCKASDIIIHYGCQRIDDYAFASCVNLSQVRIPSSVTYLGGGLILNSGQNSNSILVAMAGQEPLDEANMYSNAFVGSLSTNGVKLGLSTRAAYDAFTQNSLIQGMSFNDIFISAFANDYEDNNGSTYVVDRPAIYNVQQGNLWLVNSTSEDVIVCPDEIHLDDYGASDNPVSYVCRRVADYAFYQSNAIKSFTWTGVSGKYLIGEYVCASSTSLRKVTIDCNAVAKGAFNNSGVSEINLLEGVISLMNCFVGCSSRSLKSVKFPKSLNSIYNSFIGCRYIKKFESDCEEFERVYFVYKDCLYEKRYDADGNNIAALCRVPPSKEMLIYNPIHPKTRIIGSYAYYDHMYYDVLDIPYGVTTIEDYAFEEACVGAIHIPSSVTTFGNNIFKTSRIMALNFGAAVPPLPYNVMLKLIECQNTFHNSMYIFCPAESLNLYTQTFNYGGNKVYIGGYDVYDTSNNVSYRIKDDNTATLCMGTYDNPNIPTYVSIQYTNYEYVARDYLYDWEDGIYTRVLKFKETIKVNEKDYELDEVSPSALAGLRLISGVTLPSTVNKIGDYAMANLPTLQTVTAKMTTLPELGLNVWGGTTTPNTVSLYVPAGMKATYAAADQWKDFGYIYEGNVSYDLYVKGIQVTSSNCDDILGDGTVSYDPVGNKLTLNNATINSATQCIRSKIAGLHIILKGTNTMSSQQYTYGIWLEESDGVVIEGDGTLIMNALSIGYFTKSSSVVSTTIKDCTIRMPNPNSGMIQNEDYDVGLTIDNANIYIGDGYIQTAPSLVLRNCKVTKPEGGYSDGIEIVAPGSTSMWWGELEIVATGSQGVPGDVDGDGHVSSVDVTALYNYLLNNDDSAIVNGDQDGDGHISSVDVTFVYNILLGN